MTDDSDQVKTDAMYEPGDLPLPTFSGCSTITRPWCFRPGMVA